MKKHHYTIGLSVLFLTGLFVLWWADPTGIGPIDTDEVLPGLGTTPVAELKRLEVLVSKKDGGKPVEGPPAERIVIERRDEGRWQILEPFDAAADPSLVETLARNLKDMRKSLDSGTIHDPPGTFGLAPPEAIVRVFGADPKKPLATLDVGRTVRDLLYVRPEGGKGIEVIDPRMLSMLGLAPVDWRDKSLFHLPSFRVGTIAVSGPGRDLKAERDEGHWHLVRPFSALAEDDTIEGIVAELTSLRVARGDRDNGFVANDLKGKDDAKYGLDHPLMTIELRPAVGSAKPQTLVVGKPVPDQPDLHYARSGDQDDIVLIDVKNFRDLGRDPNAVRSHKVVDLTPARVEFIRIEAFGRTFDLSRTANGWEQLRPTSEPADALSVQRLLNKLGEAQASEFLDASKVTDAGIDPPQMTITLWQAGPLAKATLGLDAPPKTEPRVVLQIGSHDRVRKLVHARLEGDRSLLALPDTLVDALPQNPLAFRDRTVLMLGPTRIERLEISREGTTYELAAPAGSGKSTHWRMVAPVDAPADEEAVTKMVVLLGNLSAEAYVTDQIGDGKAFGLHAPPLTVTWTTSSAEATAAKAKAKDKEQTGPGSGTLRIGAKLPKSDLSYANIEGSPIVFTLRAAAIEPFKSEFHTHRVLSFPVAAARRLVLRWADRSFAFKPQENPAGKGTMWVPETGEDISGFDLSRLGPLVSTLASLQTPKFVQYKGPIAATTGLDRPPLLIEVHLADNQGTRELRLGRSDAEQTYATTGNGKSGAVFFVTGPAWHDLIQAAPRGGEQPERVSTVGDGKPAEGEPKAPRP